MRSSPVFATILAAFGYAAIVAAVPAAAQTTAQPAQGKEVPAALKKEYDAAFAAVLADPGNLDKTFRYAELAVAVGDLEGAIGALERMLIYNPDLPRVRLELGSLYFRLGSYAIAKSYLTRAIKGENVPDDVRERVVAFLDEIEKRSSLHRFSGSIYAGGRYQTNANAGPSGRGVKVFGVDAVLDEEFTSQEDYNLFALASLRHAYDLQTQDGDFFETNFRAFGSKQIEQTQVDLFLGELDTGPRMKLLPGTLKNGSWRPYVLGDGVHLDDALFFYTGGGGVNVANQFRDDLLAEVTVEARFRRYNDTDDQPNNTDRDADEYQVRLQMAYRPTPDIEVLLVGYGVDENAAKGFNSNQEFGARLGYTQIYDAPFGVTSGRWITSVSAERVFTDYRTADLVIDPFRTRQDKEWRFILVINVPVTPDWSIVGTAGRSDTKSNLPNFKRDNNFGSLGAAWQF